MKVHIERNVLAKALGHSHNIVEKRATIPILSHVLLQTEEGKIKIAATDLELGIIELIDARVEIEGAVTVLEHMLYEIVRRLPDGSEITLELDAESSQLIVLSGASRFTLSCLPAKDFPAVYTHELPYHFTINQKDLTRLFKGTSFAMSTEETRYYLNGIYLHPYENQELRAVATDGHRLARVSVPLPEGAENFPGIIISSKTIAEVLKILVNPQPLDIEISLSETQISFKYDTIYLTSRLIDGTFPDYEKAIPQNNTKVLRLKTKPFLKAVERVSVISAQHSRGIKVGAQKDKLILSAVSSDIGSAVEELESNYKFEPIEMGFNSKYLVDIAGQMDDGEAEFAFSDNHTAVIIRNITDAQALYVLMPMRV